MRAEGFGSNSPPTIWSRQRSDPAPYTIEAKEIAWWSVYEIGQRLCGKFDDVPEEAGDERLPRVFIAGDACHTHSPKAGQGMNVSMQDGFNLGWKLASVLRKRSAPHLLHTYSAERQAVAKELIDFDRESAKMFSAPPKTHRCRERRHRSGGVPEIFRQAARFAVGTENRSPRSSPEPNASIWRGWVIGMRFHRRGPFLAGANRSISATR